uniref:Uncharacterized protein n=1 Tax=Colobus angolensis palliatus TaxID=336983 RepID=A0A2K5IFS4_COLAP
MGNSCSGCLRACSVEDSRAGPGVPRESSICRHRCKKRNFRHWCPSCVRPRVVPMEDHEDLAREPSSEDVPGIQMVDKATQMNIVPEHLRAWYTGSEDEEDPDDEEKSSGVPQKELGDSTITGSHQQMSASPSSA